MSLKPTSRVIEYDDDEPLPTTSSASGLKSKSTALAPHESTDFTDHEVFHGLSDNERVILRVLRRLPQAATAEEILAKLPGATMDEVVTHLNVLSKRHFVEVLKSTQNQSKVAFMAKDPEEIAQTSTMDNNENIIYRYIKAAGNKGIWIKDLKSKSNIHSKNVQDAIKSLEKKGIIKSVKSVKNPIKKVYMLAHLVPSEEVTGGTWYTDQEFDSEFIEGLSRTALRFIESRSFPPASQSDVIFPRDYDKYPTAMEVRDILLGIVDKNMVSLSLPDTLAILDRLVYDGTIIRVTKHSAIDFIPDQDGQDGDNEIKPFLLTQPGLAAHFGYKAVKRNHSINALEAIPCGKCPVFHECADVGPITPLTCEYFHDWILKNHGK